MPPTDATPLLGRTRSQILRELTRGPRTAVQVAAGLRIQVSAVRKHLERLESMKFVAARFERSGPGRPKKFYGLTESGQELFPRRYDAVLGGLLADMVRERGQTSAERALGRVAADFARGMDGEPSTDRSQLKRLEVGLEEMGFEPELTVEGRTCTITSRNCPILRTAKEHRELVCRGLHAEVIRHATDSEVGRGKWIVDGDPVCTHTIRVG